MKNELTVNALAFGNLKQHKKQYTVMIIGIILAMVFSSSVIFMFSSMVNSLEEMRNNRFGKQDVIWANVTDEKVSDAKANKVLGKSGYAHIIGSLTSTNKNYFDEAKVSYLDDTALELANPVLIEGRMPTGKNEIAVERMMLAKLGVSAKLGDEITLNLYPQNGKEVMEECQPATYKLVGILKNKISYFDYVGNIEKEYIPTAFVSKDTRVELGGKELLTCYADFYNDSELRDISYSKFYNYLSSTGYNSTAREIYAFSTRDILHIDNEATDLMSQLIVAAVIIAVLMIASCLVIVNSFNSNLNERKKQIGMFRAIGATKSQIRSIFAREALIIALIATPVSCALSAVIVKTITNLMGEDFFFKPSAWAVALSTIFCIVCVMISASIPLISASGITPIQSIRNIENTRTLNKKKIKSKKKFDVPKLLANRSLTFGKGKQIAVSVILIIAIVGSGYAMSLYSYLYNEPSSSDCDYYMSVRYDSSGGVNFKSNNNGITEQERRLVDSNEYIGSSYGVKIGEADLLIPPDTDYRKMFSSKYSFDETNYKERPFTERPASPDYLKKSELYNVGDFISTRILSFDSEYLKSLEKYVYDGKIDVDKINSGEEILLAAPQKIGYFKDAQGDFGVNMTTNEQVDTYGCYYALESDFHAGDEIEIGIIADEKPLDSEGENNDHTIISDNAKVTKKKVKIGAVLKSAPDCGSSTLNVITSSSVMNSLIPNLKYNQLYFNLNTMCNDEVDKVVMEDVKESASNIGDKVYFSSTYGRAQKQKEEANQLLVATLSVTILLFVISISVINNTLTSHIRNSKSKIGTLRAVGADEKSIVKSYIYQLFSMLLWGSGIGLGAFFGSYYTAYLLHTLRNARLGVEYSWTLSFNPIVTIIFVVLAFLICSLNLWLKVRKEMKNSIVENIREL